jgi:hypothetical protein
MTETSEPQETRAAPFSVDEMNAFLSAVLGATNVEIARAIATAAALENLTNWILAHERDSGKAPIPALETVDEAFSR